MVRWHTLVLACCCLALVVGGAAGSGPADASETQVNGTATASDLTFTEPTVATGPAVGEETTVSAEVTVPDVVEFRTETAEMDLELVVDGAVVETETVTVTEGEATEVSIAHAFEESGDHEVAMGGSVTFGTTALTGQSPGTVVGVAENRTGTAFAVPESLEDEVEDLRGNTSGPLPTNATVLATESELFVVFTNATPETGQVQVTGLEVNRTVESEGLTFGAVVASETTFETTGTPTTVPDVAADPASYRLDLVRVNATSRSAAVLTDPDGGDDLTLASTAGVVSAAPVQPTNLTSSLAAKARTLVLNGSADEYNGTIEENVDRFVGNRTDERLPTVSFSTDFWVDTNATVDAIVLSPETAARAFVERFDRTNSTDRSGSGPLLYRVERSLDPVRFDSVSALGDEAGSLDGRIVEVTASLYQNRLSVQETLEHATGEPCGEDLLTIQTPEGPVCVNVVFDTLLHGGVAWSEPLPGQDDVIPVVGASSIHQDRPVETKVGEYRIVGEVVLASRIDDSLPDEPLLVASDLTRTDDLDPLADGTEALVESEAAALTDRFDETVRAGLPTRSVPPIAGGQPPTDLDGDALLEDIDGDGNGTVADVLAYYGNRRGSTIRNNPDAFDFDGDGVAGTVSDALALYEEIR